MYIIALGTSSTLNSTGEIPELTYKDDNNDINVNDGGDDVDDDDEDDVVVNCDSVFTHTCSGLVQVLF